MFPLPILPLPGEMVQLHVFEPRYQMLFDELEGMDLEEFGIPFSKQNNLAGVGSVMRLVTVRAKQQDGSRDVVVTSTGLFQLESFDEFPEVQPYPNGRCNPLEEWREWPLGEACERAKQALFKVMKRPGHFHDQVGKRGARAVRPALGHRRGPTRRNFGIQRHPHHAIHGARTD